MTIEELQALIAGTTPAKPDTSKPNQTETTVQTGGDPSSAAILEMAKLLTTQLTQSAAQPVAQPVVQPDLATLLASLQQQSNSTQQPQVFKPYEDGFYTDGKVDLSKVSDPQLKKVLDDLTTKNEKEAASRLVEEAYNAELATRKLAIAPEAFKKLVDLSGAKVVDGKVTGIKEAFDAHNETQGIYKQTRTALDRGTNPITKVPGNQADMLSGYTAKSFAEAQATVQ